MVSYDAADLEMREIVKGGGQGPLKKTILRLESKIVSEYRPNSINFGIILPWSTLLLDFRLSTTTKRSSPAFSGADFFNKPIPLPLTKRRSRRSHPQPSILRFVARPPMTIESTPSTNNADGEVSDETNRTIPHQICTPASLLRAGHPREK